MKRIHNFTVALLAATATVTAAAGGFVDNNFKRAAIYDGYEEFCNLAGGYAPVMTPDRHWGLIDSTGTVVVKPRYDNIERPERGLAITTNDTLFGLVDLNNPSASFEPRHRFLALTNGLMLTDSADRLTLTRRDGTPVATVDRLWKPSGNRMRYKLDRKTGYLDMDGNVAIPATFEDGSHFSEGLATVTLGDGRLAVIDTLGNERFSRDCEMIGRYNNGRAIYISNDLYGLLDTLGTAVVPAGYDKLSDNLNDTYTVDIKGKQGLIDADGNTLLPRDYIFIGLENEKMVSVWRDHDARGFFDLENKKTIGWVRDAGEFSEGLAVVEFTPGAVTFVNREGKPAFNRGFENADRFSEGLAAVQSPDNLLWHYIATDGTTAIEGDFEEARPFQDGVATVKRNGLWGAIDTTGAIVYPLVFETEPVMTDDGIKVTDDGIIYIIDRNHLIVARLSPDNEFK